MKIVCKGRMKTYREMIRDEKLQYPSKSTMPAHTNTIKCQIGRSLAKQGPSKQLKNAGCEKIARGQATTLADRDKLTTKGTLNILQFRDFKGRPKKSRMSWINKKYMSPFFKKLFYHPKKK